MVEEEFSPFFQFARHACWQPLHNVLEVGVHLVRTHAFRTHIQQLKLRPIALRPDDLCEQLPFYCLFCPG
jgi:hypothetical protein